MPHAVYARSVSIAHGPFLAPVSPSRQAFARLMGGTPSRLSLGDETGVCRPPGARTDSTHRWCPDGPDGRNHRIWLCLTICMLRGQHFICALLLTACSVPLSALQTTIQSSLLVQLWFAGALLCCNSIDSQWCV